MKNNYPILLLFSLFLGCLATRVIPLPNAHAHNDYEHPRPLFAALENGFTSIEADIYLVDDDLYVSHDEPEFKDSGKTLEKLYLEPLRRIVHQNGGSVYPQYGGVFYLMIDIKTEAEASYTLLKQQLARYQDILTSYSHGSAERKAVTIFLSGERPIQTVLAEDFRQVAIDGRPADLGRNYSPDFMPVISDNYRHQMSWQGEGKIPQTEWRKLQHLVRAVHEEGKKLRLWASPEKEKVWQVLLNAGVDFINTDQLVELKQFLLARKKLFKNH